MIRTLRELAAVLLIALVPALISAAIQLRWQSDSPLSPGEVNAATARGWGEQVVWVDARSRAQFQAGRIPGAVLLNDEEWDAQTPRFFAEWDAEKSVIVYSEDADSTRASEVADRLRNELKVGRVFVLKGGWKSWRR